MKKINKSVNFDNQYLTIFENTGAGTILIDEDTTIVLANSRFVSMLGYDKSQIEGKMSWTEFICEHDVERMKQYHYLRRKDPDAAPKNYEFRLYTKDRQLRYIYLTIDMIPNTKLSVASLVDITQLVEVRNELQKSEAKYRMLVETMNDGLLMQDETFTIQYANPRFCEIIGYESYQIIGKRITDFIHMNDQHYFMEQMNKRLMGIEEPYELTWQRKDGSSVYTIVSPRIIFDANNMFSGSFAVITDITQRKKAEELEKELVLISEKERQSIGQDLHDDLIPHLIGIDVLCKVMVQELEKGKAPTTGDIQNVRNLLTGAIVKARQFSRGLSPSYFITSQGLDSLIQELLATTQNIYGIRCEYSGYTIDFHYDTHTMTQIYYIIQEAVHNAAKHSNATTIRMHCGKRDDYNILEITDNGCGFDVSVVNGMGLKIMYHRANVIGASLRIHSQKGEGTSISLILSNHKVL